MRPAGLLLIASIALYAVDDPAGAVLYKKHCATCHESGAERVPARAALALMSSATILRALETGVMRAQGSAMAEVDKRVVSNWLGRTAATTLPGEQLSNRCT